MHFIRLTLCFFILCCIQVLPAAAGEKIPTQVGGFVLGTSVTEYPDIEYSNYLKEVLVNDRYGFRKGVISYGVCEFPGQIVKIKMKYEDSSKKYYKTLLKKFKQQYGKPDVWKGDSFGIILAWKWKFTDKDNNQIDLVLQHNLQDIGENIGNQVKLFYPQRMELERLCFIKRCEINAKQQKRMNNTKPDWRYLIPR